MLMGGIMGNRELESAKKTVSSVLKDKFHTDGKTLKTQVRKARRKLPYKARLDVDLIIEGEEQLKNPILRKRVDTGALKTAKRRFLRRTGKIDLKKDRKRKALFFATDIVLKLMICAGLAYFAVVFFT